MTPKSYTVFSKSLRRGHRGASLTSYGLVVGLIAILAIGAVASVGDEISGLFGGVGDEMDAVATGSGSGSSSGAANQPPVAADDGGVGFVTDEDTAFTTGDVLANDSDADAGDTLSVVSFDTTGTLGQVADNGNGTFDYAPDGQFESLNTGDQDTDSFTYTISDGTDTATATVTITIDGVNDGPEGPACTGGNVIGCEAPDGAFFAGTVGGNDIFIAPADEDDTASGTYEVPNTRDITDDTPQCCTGDGIPDDQDNKFFAWNNDQDQDTTADSLTDGLANTQELVGDVGGNSGRHPAAEVCNDKSLGSADWFLPARDELHSVWDNLADNGEGGGTADDGNLHADEQSFAETAYGFDFSGNLGFGRYWSSSESDVNHARNVRFVDGDQGVISKSVGLSVRCVRR